MKKHDWQYKSFVDNTTKKPVYMVVCSDCGRMDHSFITEEAAKGRMKALANQKSFSQTLLERFTKVK